MAFNIKAHVKMLIRKPVSTVFSAFIEPEILTQFWLKDATHRLEVGKKIRWDFMVQGASVEVTVKELELNKRILIGWADGTSVEWIFERTTENMTIVSIENYGFAGSDHEIVANALDATEGFTIVLCDLKSFLESGTSHNLCKDKAVLIELASTFP